MIFADIQTTIGTMLALLGFFVGLVMIGAFLLLRVFCRSARDSYEKGGGTPQLLKNVATRGAGQMLKRLIFKR